MMKTKFGWLWAVAVVGLLASAGMASAQNASLGLVPSSSPIVIQVNGIDKARDRLGKLLGNAVPDLAPKLIKQIDDAIKEVSEGRDLKPIVKDARVYVVVSDLAELPDSPKIAIHLPITGYTEFKNSFLKEDERKSLKKNDGGYDSIKVEGIEEPINLVERKEYLILTNDADVAKSYVKGAGDNLAKTLSRETAQAFLGQDASVYVNLKMINKEYGAKIKGFKALLDLGLGAGGMGINKRQGEMIKMMFNSLLSLLDDGEALVLGFDFRPEGANLRFLTQFASDTETNLFLKKLKPASLKDIGALSSGQLVYSISNFDLTTSKTMAAMMKEAQADDEDEDAKKAIEAAVKELMEIGQIQTISAGNQLNSMFSMTEFKDGAKANAAMLKMFKAMTKTGSYAGVPFKDKPVIKEGAETIGDYKMTQIRFAYDFDKAVESLPETAREGTKNAMIKTMGETPTLWFGVSGNKMLSVTGTDWKEAKGSLEAYLKPADPLERDESFIGTRKQLPADISYLFAADSARFIQAVMDMVRETAGGLPGFGGGIPELKAPKGKPAYSGMALTMKDEIFAFDVFIPVVAVQQVRKMLAPLIEGDN